MTRWRSSTLYHWDGERHSEARRGAAQMRLREWARILDGPAIAGMSAELRRAVRVFMPRPQFHDRDARAYRIVNVS